MLRIRLQRIGKKKQPTYRLIVSEKTKDTQAGSLEMLGEYNPVSANKVMNLKEDRIKHWISVGAEPSNTVHNLLVKAGVIKEKAKKAVTITNKRQGKIDQKNAAAEEAKKAAQEAKKAEEEAKAAEAAAAAEAKAEAPAEDAPAEEGASEASSDEEPKKEDAPSA